MKENSNRNKLQAEEPEDLFWFAAVHREVNYIENNLWIPDRKSDPLIQRQRHPS